MQTRQGNMLESLRNVKTFLDQHADALGGVINTGTRDNLLEAIAALEGYGNQQAAGAGASKNATKVTRALRRTLVRDHMSVVSRIGRAKLPHTPELETLKMPRGQPSSSRLAAAAYEMANSADANAQVFISAGLPADFVAQLKSAADAMIDARQHRSMSLASRTAATLGLKSTLSVGRKLVHVLDAMIQSALLYEPALRAGWNQVKRVPKVTGPSANAASAPDATATT